MITRTKLAVLAVVVVSGLSLACANKGISDSQLTADIQSKLYADPATKQGSIAVAVNNGAVTLTGEVPSSDVELAAMKIANSTAGVQGVTDQLKVNNVVARNQGGAPPVAVGNNFTNRPVARPPASRPEPSYPAVTAPARSELPPNASASPSPDRADARSEPVARPLPPAQVTISSGERLSVRTIDAIDSGKMSEGQALRASLEAPLVSQGQVIVPAGAPVTLEITSVKGANRIKGNSELSVRATSLSYKNRNYPISTSVFSEQGKARGKNTAVKTGLGAAAGALIGGLAGGGKGAAIGAAAGGGAGFGYNAMTHGQQVKIPSETVLNFQLESPLTVPAPR